MGAIWHRILAFGDGHYLDVANDGETITINPECEGFPRRDDGLAPIVLDAKEARELRDMLDEAILAFTAISTAKVKGGG
jgi:hypothetical protein